MRIWNNFKNKIDTDLLKDFYLVTIHSSKDNNASYFTWGVYKTVHRHEKLVIDQNLVT